MKERMKSQISHFRIHNNIQCLCTHISLYIVHALYAFESLCCAYGYLYVKYNDQVTDYFSQSKMITRIFLEVKQIFKPYNK
jgi:hypothetical protein